MTALDDAIDQSVVTYGPHQVQANWRESDGDADADINADSPTNLTTQLSGSMKVEHSLVDGWPEPVSRTGQNNGTGILSAELIGKEGLTLSSSGNRAYHAGGTSWDTGAATTVVTGPIPTTTLRGDYIVCVVLVDDDTAVLEQAITDPRQAWEFLGTVSDAPLAMHVYGRKHWRDVNPYLTLTADKPVDFVSQCISFWARNPTNMVVDYRVTHANLIPESASTTTHTVASSITDRGYQVGFWGSTSAAGAITVGAGLTAHGASTGNGLLLTSGISGLRESGETTLSATQSPANAIMCKAAISIEPYARPRMDARQYFSPFNKDSPIYGWTRDTADVMASLRVLTESGGWDTEIFKGRMQGIPIRGREATLAAVSKTRIWLNRSISLPIISAVREHLSIDWMVTYLMARGGTFAGPAPNRYTRYWAPLYGSTHAHWDSPFGYNLGLYRHSGSPLNTFGTRYPDNAEGRWASAMYGQQTATEQREIFLSIGNNLHNMSTDDFPHINEAGGFVLADMMSNGNSKGRVQVWLRGDATVSAPGYLAAGDDYLFKFYLSVNREASVGANVGVVECGVASNTRRPYIYMGNVAGGYTSTSFVHTALPVDGEWHFYGFSWDFAAGSANVCYDGAVITSVSWATNGNNVTTQFPSTDAIGRERGDTVFLNMRSHLPVSDFILDFGEAYVAGQWTEHYPTPKAPGNNVDYRPVYQNLAALSIPTTVNPWELLNDLAKASLSSFRCNEQDVLEWLSLEFLGLDPQITPVAVQDTRTNSGDFDVTIDPSKVRNVVTIKYPETRIDTQIQPVLQYLTSTTIPRGTSTITFPLDVPIAEIHGQSNLTGSTWQVYNLTSSQITTPNLPKTQHYITANSAVDGSGSVLNDTQVKATMVSWESTSVTIQFVNNFGAVAYLSNNGDQVPFLQVLGYGVRTNDAYTTIRDSASVAIRGEKALETEIGWIHERGTAEKVAALMVGYLTVDTAEMKVSVVGDPQRKPGQMVTVIDAEGTEAEGTWRIWSIDHDIDGPQYVQDLSLVYVGPSAVWDDPDTPWDIGVWGL